MSGESLTEKQVKFLIEYDLLQCLQAGNKYIEKDDLKSLNWANLTIFVDGYEYGYMERIQFAPPYLVISHIAVASNVAGDRLPP